jgi:hypothetical protein
MHRVSWIAIAVLAVSTSVMAQEARITSFPPNIIVPNYNGIPTGPLGGLEGCAHIARAADASAPWFNPAGLSRSCRAASGTTSSRR